MSDDLNLNEPVSTRNLERLKTLLDEGVNIDEVDDHGNTALWRAVYDYKGDGTFVELLLANGADPNHKNKADKSSKELAYMIANYDVRKYFPEQ